MRHLTLVLVLCGFAAAVPAHAFEIQGEKATLEDGASQFTSPASQLFKPDYSQGYSLALPYIGSANSQFLSEYGNSISIPAPGVDQAAPLWALPR